MGVIDFAARSARIFQDARRKETLTYRGTENTETIIGFRNGGTTSVSSGSKIEIDMEECGVKPPHSISSQASDPGRDGARPSI